MNKPIRCTTHFHACDCREYEFEKVKRQLEIQTKRVENLKKSNVKMRLRLESTICNCEAYRTSETLKLARSCQAIDQELEKELENLK